MSGRGVSVKMSTYFTHVPKWVTFIDLKENYKVTSLLPSKVGVDVLEKVWNFHQENLRSLWCVYVFVYLSGLYIVFNISVHVDPSACTRTSTHTLHAYREREREREIDRERERPAKRYYFAVLFFPLKSIICIFTVRQKLLL